MRKSVSVRISFPNDAAGLRCLATQIRIGSKPSDNSSPKQARAEPIPYPS